MGAAGHDSAAPMAHQTRGESACRSATYVDSMTTQTLACTPHRTAEDDAANEQHGCKKDQQAQDTDQAPAAPNLVRCRAVGVSAGIRLGRSQCCLGGPSLQA